MELEESKALIEKAEELLLLQKWVLVNRFNRDGRVLNVAITERLRRSCKKGKVWKSKAFLTAFKNAEYGFDRTHAMSPGGSDGIFLLSRTYRPENEMMKKIFNRYIDKHGSGADEIAISLNSNLKDLLPVRLVSHHMRLLGLLHSDKDQDTLVLVDYDDNK